MDEIRKIADYYPEIIFVADPIKSWSGFMTIECPLNPNIQERIRLHLVAPNYPEMSDINLNFGPKISLLYNTKFKTILKEIVENATSIFILLQKIQNLAASVFPFSHSIVPSEPFSKENMIKQLKEVLLSPQEVVILSVRNLAEIILKTRNRISMRLKWKKGWEVVSFDLPDMFDFDIKKRKMELKDIVCEFLQCTEQMLEVWEQLEEIDSHCYVIDPKIPKPYHLHRRLYLSDSLSIFITLDPLNATICPDIKFLGSEVVIQELKNKRMEHLNNWNPNITVYDNLLKLLDIDEFPKPPKIEQSSLQHGCFDDNECCICFTLESEKGTQPDKMCSNVKCGRVFHSNCLLQWLQCDGTNKIIFGHIYGKCPHCEDSISCSVNV